MFHDNFGAEDLRGSLMEALHDTFLQVNDGMRKKEHSLLISKKGAVTPQGRKFQKKHQTQSQSITGRKITFWEEGQVIPPLVDMGIFNGEGKVVKFHGDKVPSDQPFLSR